MDSRAALGAAAAVALTVTGGVSALFLTVAQAAPATPEVDQTAVTVEYVDQYGNPVAAPGTATQATNPEIILLNPDGTQVTPDAATQQGYGAEAEYGEAEHEEEEYEGEEHEEEEHGEYAGAEHEEDHEAEHYEND